jgi:release factor glutamine methyltransferase
LEEPREEAIYLLAALLKLRRGSLLSSLDEPLDPTLQARFEGWLTRREGREPAQQILGDQEFYGLNFFVSRDVLIPRPETEMLIDWLIERAPEGGSVVDIGCGSGCIAITAAVKRPDLELHAVERSPVALEIARRNADAHGVCDRIVFHGLDFALFEANATFDVVVSNPPYISRADWEQLQPEVRLFEPLGALVPGESGLEAYAALVTRARGWLKPDGVCLLEIGAGQARAVESLAREAGFDRVEIDKDLNGIERRLVLHLPTAKLHR